MPDDMSANMLCINGYVVCKSEKEAPKSYAIIEQQLGPKYKIIGLDLSEIPEENRSLNVLGDLQEECHEPQVEANDYDVSIDISNLEISKERPGGSAIQVGSLVPDYE